MCQRILFVWVPPILITATDGSCVIWISGNYNVHGLNPCFCPHWLQISWESATIGFWFTDLLDRHAQFTSWLLDGRPDVFWLTGFFNPQGFLTAMRQEITRAHKGWALDAVVLDNDVTKSMKEDITSPPSEGKPRNFTVTAACLRLLVISAVFSSRFLRDIFSV